MGIIATWGTVNITEVELVSFNIKYGLRLAKLKTVYENPLLQYIGVDLKRLEMSFKTWDSDKIYQIWNERQSLGASIRAVTLGDRDYDDWYMTNTRIEFLTHDYATDDFGNRLVKSTAICALITLTGVQE